MTPADLGLPLKFREWRPGQDDAILDAAVSLSQDGPGHRFYVSSQPTGAGKSLFYIALARLLESKRTLILTVTKALQAQLESDFGSMGLVTIKGQANYPCVLEPGATVADGQCHAGYNCEFRNTTCEYYGKAIPRARAAPIVAGNYDWWMYAQKFAIDNPVGEFDLLIPDEAHEAPEKLAEFVSIYISGKELSDLLGRNLPSIDAGIEYWTGWAKEALREANIELESAKTERGSVTHIRRLRNLAGKLDDLSNAARWVRTDPTHPNITIPGQSSDWVAEEHDHGITFSPIWAHGYAERFLFAGIPRVVLTSATIIPKTVSYLGLSPETFEFNERNSTFAAARRPVYSIGTIKVRFGMSRGEEMVWMNKIDSILDERPGLKTIIHTVSYKLAQFIHSNSRHRGRMMVHDNRNTVQTVDRFRRAGPGTVLVSPAVRAGWDFPYDQCELQIVAKVPFVDGRGNVLKARHKSDKNYLNYLALMSLIQSCGRGMRAADDMCETFIVDANIGWLLSACRKAKLIPKWFRVVPVDTIPLPLARVKRRT